MDTLDIPFGAEDKKDLDEFKREVLQLEREDSAPLKRHRVVMPEIEASTEENRKALEDAFDSGTKEPRGMSVKLPPEVVEGAKAAFISTGGNISHVAAMYDLTSEAVLRLASENEWPVYAGSVMHGAESQSRAQLTSLAQKLWQRIEDMLDAMNVETKAKASITQYRTGSEYIEPLASRSSAFKVLMDQYMRVQTILEPETFSDDPDSSNFLAKRNRERDYPGGVEGVNREMADFFSQVVVGIADRIKDKELQGYGNVIDARSQ